MELGFWVLGLALVAAWIISLIDRRWLKAAGGLLILATIIGLALQIAGIA